MGERLALAGIDSHFQVKVGDNRQRIADTIRYALSRSDAVILCGGLGPTQDDITREAIAQVMDVALVRDEAMGGKIRRGFEARGRRFTENNLRQAEYPAGASFIPEMRAPPRDSSARLATGWSTRCRACRSRCGR